jgi:hypothetical protein
MYEPEFWDRPLALRHIGAGSGLLLSELALLSLTDSEYNEFADRRIARLRRSA